MESNNLEELAILIQKIFSGLKAKHVGLYEIQYRANSEIIFIIGKEYTGLLDPWIEQIGAGEDLILPIKKIEKALKKLVEDVNQEFYTYPFNISTYPGICWYRKDRAQSN